MKAVPVAGAMRLRQLEERMSYVPRFPPHSWALDGSSGLFPIILEDAVKLLHQVGELCWVVFLNDGLSEVLPCFPRITNHSRCFFQGIRARNISSPDDPYPRLIWRYNSESQPGFKRSASSGLTLPV
jgi:hypothetical protein